MEFTMRSLNDNDTAAVQLGLYYAVGWNQTNVPPLEQAMQHPQLGTYWHGWGRPGDLGVVAEIGSEVVGSAFARLFSSREESEGFVDTETPELAIGVDPEHRGRGIGRKLMILLEEEALRRGFDHLSLSVHLTNPAMKLYRSLGYRELDRDTKSARMVKGLTPAE